MIKIRMNSNGECVSIEGGGESTQAHIKRIAEKMKIGEHRVVKRFLWKPLILNGTFKWLQNVDIVQVKRRKHIKHSMGGSWRLVWEDYKFKEDNIK